MTTPVFKNTLNQGPYQRYWSKYIDIKSTSNRKQFWLPVLWNALIHIGILSIGGLIFSLSANKSNLLIVLVPILIGLIAFNIATLIPNITNMVRRYHDIGISGWWLLLLDVFPAIVYSLDENLKHDYTAIIVATFVVWNIIYLVLPTNAISHKYHKSK